MSAIHIAQTTAGIVVIGKEQRGVTAVTAVLIEQLIHGLEQSRQVVQGYGVLAAQVGLEIGHQKSAGYPLARDVRQHQRQPAGA